MSRRLSAVWRAVGLSAGVAAVTLTLLVAVLGVGGYDVGAALRALAGGAFGSWSAFLSGTLVRATPLLFAGLAVAIAFRAGVLNIGAEGQLVVGAAVAAAVSLTVGLPLGIAALPLALLAGAVSGAAWAAIAAVLRARFGVLEVISTIMLNFIAQYGLAWLVRGPLQEPTHTYPQSEAIASLARLPALAAGVRLHWGFVLALAAAVALWLMLKRTASGFRVRAVGANPFAAASAGRIDAVRVGTGAFLLSGALAGLGGAVEVGGVTYALYENISPGYGYTAIAVALLARLNPLLVVASAVLFGALEAGAVSMQRDAAVPSVVVSVVEAVLILVVVATDSIRDRWFSIRWVAEREA